TTPPPLHGDFNEGQVLINEREAGIVDLDSPYCGEPAEDLGCLLAQMETQRLLGKLETDAFDRMRSALLEGYGGAGNGPMARRIYLYTASGLLRRARFAFRSRKQDWPQIIEASLDRMEEILAAE